MSSFIKIRPVGAELFHWTDRQSEAHDEANSSRNFANEPKNVLSTQGVCMFCTYLRTNSDHFHLQR